MLCFLFYFESLAFTSPPSWADDSCASPVSCSPVYLNWVAPLCISLGCSLFLGLWPACCLSGCLNLKPFLVWPPASYWVKDVWPLLPLVAAICFIHSLFWTAVTQWLPKMCTHGNEWIIKLKEHQTWGWIVLLCWRRAASHDWGYSNSSFVVRGVQICIIYAALGVDSRDVFTALRSVTIAIVRLDVRMTR